jgi:hypothetical protein
VCADAAPDPIPFPSTTSPFHTRLDSFVLRLSHGKFGLGKVHGMCADYGLSCDTNSCVALATCIGAVNTAEGD